ncbi:hypothetical protein N4G69_43710 [Streptomyces mirabilis]|uniref:hypothetical protein n=1 Tax=Streptomyces mirabilis TaxID=68239 RepID=UPI0021BE7FFD|nr:hypothetical protein [Streptomyces mirabilis]MCT9112415.1 hypothetical protein [Streptomyces mirabilis]
MSQQGATRPVVIHMAGRYPTASPGPKRGTLVDAMLERQGRNVRFWQRMLERTDTVETAAQQIDDRITWSRHERAHIARYRHVFESALG